MALKLIQLYKAFGANPERVTFCNLALSSLCLIAAPKTPLEARDEVIRRLEAGEVVSRAEVQRIIQEEKAKLEANGTEANSLRAAGPPQACSAGTRRGR